MTVDEIQPKDLEEAVSLLLTNLQKDEEGRMIAATYSERNFLALTHVGIGRIIRNVWGLWKNSERNDDISPEEEPELVKWFKKNLGIWHADDMSGIILTTVYRRFHNMPENVEEQAIKYHKHWDEKGIT